MIENMNLMRCGGCGNADHKVYNHDIAKAYMVLVCNECKSESILEVSLPTINIKWGDNSKGILCNFQSDRKIK